MSDVPDVHAPAAAQGGSRAREHRQRAGDLPGDHGERQYGDQHDGGHGAEVSEEVATELAVQHVLRARVADRPTHGVDRSHGPEAGAGVEGGLLRVDALQLASQGRVDERRIAQDGLGVFEQRIAGREEEDPVLVDDDEVGVVREALEQGVDQIGRVESRDQSRPWARPSGARMVRPYVAMTWPVSPIPAAQTLSRPDRSDCR